MPALAIWESSDNWQPILKRLSTHHKMDIKVWIGTNPQCTFQVHNFDYGNLPPYAYKGYSKDIYDIVYPHVHEFSCMYFRNYRPYAQNAYACKTIFDILDIFNQLVEFFCQILIDNKIDVLIFSRMFHLGADYLMYLVAQALGIRTIIPYQGSFPGRFFYTYTLEDFGIFKDIHPICPPEEPFILPTLQDIHWNYMDRKITHPVFHHAGNSQELKNFPHIHLENEFTEKCHAAYLNSLQSIFLQRQTRLYQDVDIEGDFVYFPLHLQPEMTTSPLGGPYNDQILALECLRNVLPQHWKILIKENPHQTFYQRGPWFYQRVKSLPNVFWVSPETNTKSLILGSRFVATITGTAGYEALLAEKCALTFGRAWYNTLPGIFSYTKDISLNAILSHKVSRGAVQDRVNELLTLTGKGYMYGRQSDIHTPENIITVSHMLKAIIESTL